MLAFEEESGEGRRVQPDVSESTLSTLGGMGLEVKICCNTSTEQTAYEESLTVGEGTDDTCLFLLCTIMIMSIGAMPSSSCCRYPCCKAAKTT